MPRRLIDVQPADGSVDARLVLTDDLRSNGARLSYTTLSHCWGQPDTATRHAMITTPGSLPLRLAGISLQSLPRTFQDAITITRELRIRYLWIDSLCILQQSPTEAADHETLKDWDEESENMNSIYEEAEICIIAAASDNPAGGCFVQTIGMPPRVTGGNWKSCFEHESLECRRTLAEFAQSGPLARRAWCLQERFLSRRILHYTEYGMLWECLSAIKLDDSIASTPLYKSASFGWQLLPEKSNWLAGAYKDWHKVIQEYTPRSLTKDTDRLSAISGLAKGIANLTEDTYVAGLWLSKILDDLLWHCDVQNCGTGICARQQSYIAPSWSWGALKGPVLYSGWGDGHRYPARLLSHAVIPSGRNTLGSQRSGHIWIAAPMKKICIVFWKYKTEKGETLYLCNVAEIDAPKRKTNLKAFMDDRRDGPSNWEGCHTMWCIWLRETPEANRKDGLLLLPVSLKTYTFRRVGYFNWWHNGEFCMENSKVQKVRII
ncbi:hypothetical protein H2200_009414 [Cladophialophora chaetospira]|uniref:Heterokaryon incompatibility domain-containing protein n=1 Tax=Cladophialophora chaetospira TaxID=386627 RepID=A0AA38X447_9EURO|nr:hypothetical protein H2200_009414 [Cladophialophora chaetospira]